MPMPRLSFIIATRDRRDPLMRCLASVEAQRYAPIEVIVVDDASSDGTAEAVREAFPSARVLRNPQRRGLGATLAAGAAVATGDIFVNLDDDCRFVSDDSAERAARYFIDDPGLTALCFRVEAPDGSVRRREIPLRRKRMPSEPTEIGYFLGGAVALRAADVAATGGYPSEIDYGSNEHDMAYRIFKAGGRMFFAPEVRVVHEAVPSPHNTVEREANYVRDEVRLAARYLPAPYAQVHALLWVALSLYQAARTGHLRPTARAAASVIARWGSVRKDRDDRLSLAQTRRLSRVSGRTWY
jgi:GT2 family glycosyltransferase